MKNKVFIRNLLQSDFNFEILSKLKVVKCKSEQLFTFCNFFETHRDHSKQNLLFLFVYISAFEFNNVSIILIMVSNKDTVANIYAGG